MADVRGQDLARRALEIAAAGGHNLLFVGPPGSGKTMLARRLPGLLPRLSLEEALETSAIHSAAGARLDVLLAERPFRAPHHTASDVAIVGGGSLPRPGEVSLAHNGVLFLDELPEFPRNVLEALRQPLEERTVTIARARGTLHLPARFQLIAAMNPCPCGRAGQRHEGCGCTPAQVASLPAPGVRARCSTGSTSRSRWARSATREMTGPPGEASAAVRRAGPGGPGAPGGPAAGHRSDGQRRARFTGAPPGGSARYGRGGPPGIGDGAAGALGARP